MKKERKGQVTLSQTPNLISVLIVIGFFLAIAALVIQEFRDSDVGTTNAAQINDTVTGAATRVQLANTELAVGSERVHNASGLGGTSGELIDATNYTMDFGGGGITMDDSRWNSQAINVSYDFRVQNTFFNSTRSTDEGIAGLGDFQSLFGIIIAAAVVLGVIMLIRRS